MVMGWGFFVFGTGLRRAGQAGVRGSLRMDVITAGTFERPEVDGGGTSSTTAPMAAGNC